MTRTEISCSTETLAFHQDVSLVQVQTTDEYGDPYDWGTEGTWSVDDDLLAATLTKEAPDADSLQPIEPPDSSNPPTWRLPSCPLRRATPKGPLAVAFD